MKYLFLILILFANPVPAQQITVLDSLEGKPVEGISISSGSFSLVTGREGTFGLEVFSSGDTLILSHIAYGKRIIPFEELKKIDTLFLVRTLLKQSDIEVLAHHTSEAVSFTENILLDKQLRQTANSIGDLLSQNTSLYLKNYGTGSGLQAVSSRGMSSENTLVLFNEARVNDLRTGIFDFSLLSVSAIDKIVYTKSADYQHGLTSPGGVVKISTGHLQPRTGGLIGSKAGSNGLRSIFGEANHSIDEFRAAIRFDRSYSGNNYNYLFEGNEYKRRNAHFSKIFLSADLGRVTKNHISQLYYHYSVMDSGIPGFVVTNNTHSSRAMTKSISQLFILNDDLRLTKRLLLQSVFSLHSQRLTLFDPDDMLIFEQRESTSGLRDISGSLSLRYEEDNLSLFGGYEFGYADLTDMPAYIANDRGIERMQRRSHTMRLSALFTDSVDMAGIRLITLGGLYSFSAYEEYITGNSTASNGSFAFSLGLGTALPGTSLKFGYSSSFRFPTFNERYFSTLIYPEPLNFESYNAFDAGVESVFEWLGSNVINLNYFYIDGSDKIIWVPSRLALQIPRNVGKVESTGIEASITKYAFAEKLLLTLRYTYTEALNKTALSADDYTYNKQLVYTPRHRFQVNGLLSAEPFTFSASAGWTGESYYTADNDPFNRLDSYLLIDAAASYTLAAGIISHVLTINVYNILNTDYRVIQSYPMPLRSFSLTYRAEIL